MADCTSGKEISITNLMLHTGNKLELIWHPEDRDWSWYDIISIVADFTSGKEQSIISLWLYTWKKLELLWHTKDRDWSWYDIIIIMADCTSGKDKIRCISVINQTYKYYEI